MRIPRYEPTSIARARMHENVVIWHAGRKLYAKRMRKKRRRGTAPPRTRSGLKAPPRPTALARQPKDSYCKRAVHAAGSFTAVNESFFTKYELPPTTAPQAISTQVSGSTTRSTCGRLPAWQPSLAPLAAQTRAPAAGEPDVFAPCLSSPPRHTCDDSYTGTYLCSTRTPPPQP